jgi:NAD-dependent deacetylase
MKKKIIIFTGAGVSKESGIDTFRDNGGLWMNYDVHKVAHINAWKKDPQLVLDFYNMRRNDMMNVEPNLAHEIIVDLEKEFDVTVVTQNVDNLHEKAGSLKVIHLHGELSKVRSENSTEFVYPYDKDIKIGDLSEDGHQLRPYITWFGEDLDWRNVKLAEEAAFDADVCIIVGTSMQVAPANSIPFQTKETALIYYVDPGHVEFYIPGFREYFFYHIQENATTGMQKVKEELETIFKKG